MADVLTAVQLPETVDGVRLEWGLWEIAPVMSHIPNDCTTCDYDQPPAVAVASSPDKRGRWHASRCRRCQHTTVITWQSNPNPLPFGWYVEVWTAPAQSWRTGSGEGDRG